MAATLRRLKRLATQWPVDTSRPGRDLGEHIRNWANPMKEGDWKVRPLKTIIMQYIK